MELNLVFANPRKASLALRTLRRSFPNLRIETLFLDNGVKLDILETGISIHNLENLVQHLVWKKHEALSSIFD